MARATGLGGVFFRSRHPGKAYAWYRKNLGIEADRDSGAMFRWREVGARGRLGFTVWAAFPHDTKYFGKGRAPFMLNFRVDDLDALLRDLRRKGVKVDPRVEEYPYGRFGWIEDLEGRRVELWEPPRPRGRRRRK